MLRKSLEAKVLALIALILVVGFGVSSLLTIQRESNLIYRQSREKAQLLADSIVRSIQNNMLQGRPDIARDLIKNLHELQGVAVVQVLRRDGMEAFKDLATLNQVQENWELSPEVVRRLQRGREKATQVMSGPRFFRASTTGQPVEYMEELNGKRALTFLRPLRNEGRCQQCHGSDHEVRGVVRVSTSVEELEATIRANRNRQFLIGLGTLLVVGLALRFLLRSTVIKPLQAVAEGAECVGRGELDCRIEVRGEDEIGTLGNAFNGMTARLETAYGELSSKNEELQRALRQLQESTERVAFLESLRGQLSKFVPESVKRLLEQNPGADVLERQERDVSVLFLDLAGYTRMTEALDQETVNFIVEHYFSNFLGIVSERGGDINETAGDGLMIVFQDDDPVAHAVKAVESAIEMRRCAAALNSECEGRFPPVRVKFGINSGTASVGAAKFESVRGSRWTFTASGPVTNVAARSGAQAQEDQILVGPETARRIQDRFPLEDLGEYSLKNVREPVRLFRVITPGIYAPSEGGRSGPSNGEA
ncbi:MAG: adenylate/guanylate cyclase domain-containing protein [Nitrospinota bacterium]